MRFVAEVKLLSSFFLSSAPNSQQENIERTLIMYAFRGVVDTDRANAWVLLVKVGATGSQHF